MRVQGQFDDESDEAREERTGQGEGHCKGYSYLEVGRMNSLRNHFHMERSASDGSAFSL